jgi:hypothetical protein
MASELRLTTLANNAGTESVDTTYVINGSVKAWVNLDGTGTIAMRDSFNMASVTDNGTGDYTYTMTNSMNNANYASVAAGGTGTTAGQYGRQGPGTQYADVTTSSWTAECASNTYAVGDWNIVCWGILGDLA